MACSSEYVVASRARARAVTCATRATGELQDDCGLCQYCKDKPKFGGKGTKRQKCVMKGLPKVTEPKVAAALRLMSIAEVRERTP